MDKRHKLWKCKTCNKVTDGRSKSGMCEKHSYTVERRRKIGEKSSNRGYSEAKKLEIRNKVRLTHAKKQGFDCIEKYESFVHLKRNLRSRLNKAMKNHHKTGSAVDDLGCSIEKFKEYIESQWQGNMSWDNYGLHGWHIDHIKPLSKFNLSDPKELKVACHYNNLQPLWAKDNLAKRKIEGTI